jgi:LacI family transcriptional regulator
VVTIFTDLGAPERLAYSGLDNAAAGRTAAYLIARMAGRGPGLVLTTMSDAGFAGEGARFRAFAGALAATAPALILRDASGGGGLNPETERRIADVLRDRPPVRAVYSMGGGNRAILTGLDALGLAPEVFVAHDLDRDNRALLSAGRITVVLDHDLRADMAQAFRHILAFHRLGPVPDPGAGSEIRVITPENLPQVG